VCRGSVQLTVGVPAALEANVGIQLPGAAEALGRGETPTRTDRLMTKNVPLNY